MSRDIQLNLALPLTRAASRKQVFEILASEVGQRTGCQPRDVYNALVEKEEIARSGIANGVAIPHVRLACIQQRFITLMTLERPVDFEAPDGQPSDLVCFLASPESEGPVHLSDLSKISRLLNNTELCGKLRGTRDKDAVTELFANPEGWLIAA